MNFEKLGDSGQPRAGGVEIIKSIRREFLHLASLARRLQNYHKAYIFPIAVASRERGVFRKTEPPHVHAAVEFSLQLSDARQLRFQNSSFSNSPVACRAVGRKAAGRALIICPIGFAER